MGRCDRCRPCTHRSRHGLSSEVPLAVLETAGQNVRAAAARQDRGACRGVIVVTAGPATGGLSLIEAGKTCGRGCGRGLRPRWDVSLRAVLEVREIGVRDASHIDSLPHRLASHTDWPPTLIGSFEKVKGSDLRPFALGAGRREVASWVGSHWADQFFTWSPKCGMLSRSVSSKSLEKHGHVGVPPRPCHPATTSLT